MILTLEALKGGGGGGGRGGLKLTPLNFFGLIAKSHAICVLTAKSQFFVRNLVNTDNFTMDSTYFVDYNC